MYFNRSSFKRLTMNYIDMVKPKLPEVECNNPFIVHGLYDLLNDECQLFKKYVDTIAQKRFEGITGS